MSLVLGFNETAKRATTFRSFTVLPFFNVGSTRRVLRLSLDDSNTHFSQCMLWHKSLRDSPVYMWDRHFSLYT